MRLPRLCLRTFVSEHGKHGSGRLRHIVTWFMPLSVLLGLLGVLGVAAPSLLLLTNLSMVAGESSVILLLATGQTMAILLGGIDLSMAALAALASVLIALTVPTMGFGGVSGVLVLTTLLGTFQGALHARAQIPSIIVTLAGLGMWSGIALAVARATIPVSQGYSAVGWLEGNSFGVPRSFAFAVTLLFVLAAALRWLPLGRSVYAIGLNPRAALLSGIRVERVKILVFSLAGLFSGLAGMVMVARTSSGSPTIADSLLLPSIAAVLIGGTAITGGVGGLGRTLIGALIITLFRIGIAATGLDPAYEPIIYGVLVVLAAALVTNRSSLEMTGRGRV